MEILVSALGEISPSGTSTLVMGILRDKDWAAMCRMVAPRAGRILLVPVNSERTATTRELADVCRAANPQARVTECAGLGAALEATASDPFVVVAGSLYLVGEAMELLHLSAAGVGGERGLNEWSAVGR
jgi:dihydrofolate synthase/folylpolyglutamate synthase